MKKKILLAWSSGKDSAWALHVLRQQEQYQVAGLMTTINSAFDRVAMHSTRRALVEMQAEAAGLPLIAAPIPWPCSNAEYESAMKQVCDQALAQGITAIAFGDLFLTFALTVSANCKAPDWNLCSRSGGGRPGSWPRTW
jgi:diphthamide synthase (EF-2-diphthine--ammonia ligase)